MFIKYMIYKQLSNQLCSSIVAVDSEILIIQVYTDLDHAFYGRIILLRSEGPHDR